MQGDLAEIRFHLQCHERGFILSRPLKTSSYDFLLDNGKRVYRIQVKSTSHNERRRGHDTYRADLRRTLGTKTRAVPRYLRSEADFIAVYVSPEDAWYIIPIRCVRAQVLRLYPHRNRTDFQGGRLERFRDAWNLLES